MSGNSRRINWNNGGQREERNGGQRQGGYNNDFANRPRNNNNNNRRSNNRRNWERDAPSTSRNVPMVNFISVEPQLAYDDWGEMNVDYWKKDEERRLRKREEERVVNPQYFSRPVGQSFMPDVEDRWTAMSLQDSEEEANCSRDSGLAETDDSSQYTRVGERRAVRWDEMEGRRRREREKEEDEETKEAKWKVYNNDLLMETIISHITKMSDRSQVELASTRMFHLSKRAPYRFSKGGNHLHIHFTTFDDFATIEYGTVVRTVPILTLDTRRFDNMPAKMTIALRRILDNIVFRFGKHVKKITVGGTTPFYSARGVPHHHLILTYDLLEYLLESFTSLNSLHLINCGFDDGALDICESALWRESMSRMECIELRTVWADTPSRLPSMLNSFSENLQQFTLTRFTCKRMGHAFLEQMRKARCRLREMELVMDEDSADDPIEMLCMLKECASHTESLRITVAEIGDGSAQSPKCFQLLGKMRTITNLSELKMNVMPQNAEQFEALAMLFRDLDSLPLLRSLHVEGFVDHNWLSAGMIGQLEGAIRWGLRAARENLEEISLSNFPRPTRYNAHGFSHHKEHAYDRLWHAMGESIGSRKTKTLSLTNMKFDDRYLMKIYEEIRGSAEEIYLKNIRHVSMKSVLPLINGEFRRLKRVEAEIAIDPLVLYQLGEVEKSPQLQYAKLALKSRISEEEHTTKMLRTMFSGVFLDQESPRGPLHQFVEVHNRIPGAVCPSRPAVQPHAAAAAGRRYETRRLQPPQPFDHRNAAYGPPSRPRRPRQLYGEWEVVQ